MSKRKLDERTRDEYKEDERKLWEDLSRRSDLGKQKVEMENLGSVIFHCTKAAMEECFNNLLFSLPAMFCNSNLNRNISRGMPIFLFNTTDRVLLGIFEAISCKVSLSPRGFQVEVHERLACPFLRESEFKPIIKDNYFGLGLNFTSELDHIQTAELISKFSDLAVAAIEQRIREREFRNSVLNNSSTNAQMLDGLKEFYEQITLKFEKLNVLLESNNLMVTGPEVQEQPLPLRESIFLVGGYDGSSWLSSLDLYCPSQDTINSLEPMIYGRPHAAVAKSSNELYVFGGGNKYMGYDTVESYNLIDKQWSPRPSLNEKKYHLAGAVLDDKVFALGGCTKDGQESLSCVEMYDATAEKWILTSPMLQKRSEFGAVELNGVLYAVGGVGDGKYLQSAERFDPREQSWSRILGMKFPRAGHSLVVQNGKLFALGGYDGRKVLSSVEMYDPRLGRWIIGEPMNSSRVHAAAAVLKDSIYAIGGTFSAPGGILTSAEMTSTVERHVDGWGWQLLKNFRGPAKRSCAGALVVEDDM